jgi:hypothetical protein
LFFLLFPDPGELQEVELEGVGEPAGRIRLDFGTSSRLCWFSSQTSVLVQAGVLLWTEQIFLRVYDILEGCWSTPLNT